MTIGFLMFLFNLLFCGVYTHGLCFIKRHVWRVKMFHETVHKAWIFFNLPEQSLENSDFWLLIDFRSIECSFRSNEHESNIDRGIQRLQDYFLTIFDRSSERFDQLKMLNFEFSLRKFQNLNFHFMKRYSPNSNIIITTYPCIYLYIQQSPTRLE